jgi:carboxylesterase type B
MRLPVSAFLFLFLVPLFVLSSCASSPPLCRVDLPALGAVSGRIDESVNRSHICVFAGIPFAEPPTGKLRWQPPVPKTPWKPSVLKVVEYGAACPQNGVQVPFHRPGFRQDEDCLTLNVFAPAVGGSVVEPRGEKERQFLQRARLPVMVFLYGGGFTQGDSSDPLYDGAFLARGSGHSSRNATSPPVVAVTLNYRLGALGFLVAPNGPRGNLAIQDQRLALAWVQKNIEHFGGDPAQVTLFGQSAGGISTLVHFTSRASFGLFSRVAVESGVPFLEFRSVAKSEFYGAEFASLLQCLSPAGSVDWPCMMAKNVSEILDAQGETMWLPLPFNDRKILPWQPTVDGDIVDGSPLPLIERGQVAPGVPILIGDVRNEARSFLYGFRSSPISYLEWVALLDVWYGATAAEKLEALYRSGSLGRSHLPPSPPPLSFAIERTSG